MRRLALLVWCAGCGDAAAPPASGPEPDPQPVVIALGDAVDAHGEGRVDVTVAVEASREVIVTLGGQPRIVELAAELSGVSGAIDGEAFDGWLPPRATDRDVTLALSGDGEAHIAVWARGGPLPPAERARSLVWTDAALLDDPAALGLGRILAAASDDGHGGVMLDRWFRRFASTAHSERAGPAQLMEEIALVQGPDPAGWDLDALPFVATAVHNRIDLAARGGGCGELRISYASTHPIYAPLHLIFLFRQAPADGDVAPDGRTHCAATARRWTRLSELDAAGFHAGARALLDDTLRHDGFLLAETVELTVSPWEWRQWTPVAADTLDNPPLFQTVDTPAINAPGALRDAFLAFVRDNAAALAERTLEIPASFRARSAQAPPSVPRVPLDLSGLDPALLSAYPDLAQAIEIVGCPSCHTTDAEFIQTKPDRTFSPFYDAELDARAARLDAMNDSLLVPAPPFGPLQ